MSPTLNVKPTLFVILCGFFWKFTNLQCCNYCHLPSDFHPSFIHPWQIFHHKLLTREGRVWANGWNYPSSMTIFVKLVQKKFHPKSDHKDIKYHMTLNIIFNVVAPNFSYPGPSTNVLLLLNHVFNLPVTGACRWKIFLSGRMKV